MSGGDHQTQTEWIQKFSRVVSEWGRACCKGNEAGNKEQQGHDPAGLGQDTPQQMKREVN